MSRIAVTQRWGESFDVSIRGHRLVVDQPVVHGGDDDGPTPTELLVAALAGGVAYRTQQHLARAGLAREPLTVGADFVWDDEVPQLASIRLRLVLPAGLTPAQREAAVEAASASTVWQALREPPEIELVVDVAAPTPTPARPAPVG